MFSSSVSVLLHSEIVKNANLKDYSSDSFFKCMFMELDGFSFI